MGKEPAMSGPLPKRIPTIEEQADEIRRLKKMVVSCASRHRTAKAMHEEALQQYEDARKVLLLLVDPGWNEEQ